MSGETIEPNEYTDKGILSYDRLHPILSERTAVLLHGQHVIKWLLPYKDEWFDYSTLPRRQAVICQTLSHCRASLLQTM